MDTWVGVVLGEVEAIRASMVWCVCACVCVCSNDAKVGKNGCEGRGRVRRARKTRFQRSRVDYLILPQIRHASCSTPFCGCADRQSWIDRTTGRFPPHQWPGLSTSLPKPSGHEPADDRIACARAAWQADQHQAYNTQSIAYSERAVLPVPPMSPLPGMHPEPTPFGCTCCCAVGQSVGNVRGAGHRARGAGGVP